MNDGPLTQRARDLLARLAEASAERHRREAAMEQRRAEVTARADAAYAEVEAAARADCEAEVGAADDELAREREELEAGFRDEEAEARRRMKVQLATFIARTDALESRAEREHQEATWLAETIVESGESKASIDHEVAQKAARAGLDEVAKAQREADTLLRRAGHGGLPRVAAAGPDEPPPDPAAAFAAARQAVADQLIRLDERVRPGWLHPAAIAGLALLAALAGAGFALVRSGPDPRLLASWAIVGAGLAAVVMLILRLLARRRVPAAARAMAEALHAARRAGEHTLARADDDRRAHIDRLIARRDEEIAAANQRHAAAMQEVNRRRNEELPRLRERHEAALAGIAERFRAAIADAEQRSAERTAAAEAERDRRLEAARRERHSALHTLQQSEEAELADLEPTWKRALATAHAEARALMDETNAACPPWDDPAWDAYRPRSAAPPGTPFGRVEVDLAALPGGPPRHERLRAAGPSSLALPALLEWSGRGSLLIKATPDSRERALDLLRTVMLRILATFPPGKARFTIIDPVGLGRSFAGFMHLADHDENLVGAKIWTESRHVEAKLGDLTEHMENVIQKYLRNEFATIQDYNAQAGEVAEPFRFLVIADWPANFTEAAARRLASIATSGARCGVYTLIAADLRGRIEEWVPIGEVERASLTLAWDQGRFAWRHDDFGRWPLALDPAPDEARLTTLLHEVGRAARDVGRVQVPFETVAPDDGALWSLDATDQVSVPLGRAGARKLQHLTLGQGTAQHALIAGRTGSGKSTLLHVIITNLALWHSPDEVELYLVDFKKGVEFKTYATHQVPHARVVAVESEREFGLSVLRRLDAELTRRGALFRDAGVQDVAGYRRSPAARDAAPLPRVLLIVDEFQEFFVEDDKIAQEASLLLDRLVRQGRAFGMHVVLGSQTLGGAYSIARSTMGQMGVRIALQCSEADSYLILSEDNAAARLLSRPGEAIYNDASGLVEGNSPFQVVWLPDDKRDAALRRVRQAAQRAGRADPPPIVFEGNIPADLERNHLLAALLDGSAVPAPAGAQLWLGDAISIKDPTSATLRRQSGSNLLIVGHQDEPATAMMLAAIVALAAHHAPDPNGAPANSAPNGDANAARLVILDGTPADALHAGILEWAAGQSPIPAKVAGVREASDQIAALAAELDRRETPDTPAAPPIYLVIHGLQRFRDLRKGDDFSFSMDDDAAASPARQLARLLRDGPPHGMHVLAWCDTAGNLDRFLDRSGLREFDARVLMQMSATDSTHLIDTPAASHLGRFRALLYQEESGTLEKFRPYAMPRREWIAESLAALARRAPRPQPTSTRPDPAP